MSTYICSGESEISFIVFSQVTMSSLTHPDYNTNIHVVVHGLSENKTKAQHKSRSLS